MKHFIKCLIAALGLAVTAAALAQAYPNRPIRIILGFGAGTSTDMVARIYSEKLSQRLGQPVLVESKLGAGGSVATQFVATSPADGYTFLQGSNGSHGINVSFYTKLNYDPVKDFEPVAQLAQVPFVLVVRNDLPAKTFAEFIALARAKPNTISMGSTATASQLTGILLGQMSGVQFNRVPYKAPSPAIVDLLAGRLDAMFDTPPSLGPHIKAGAMRAIAVTSQQRTALMPDVPTVAESGIPGFESVGKQWLFAPAGTPKAIVEKISAELGAILNAPDVKELILSRGVEVATTTPARHTEMVKEEIEKWKKLFRDANMKPID